MKRKGEEQGGKKRMEGTWEGEAGWKGRMEEGGLLVGSRVERREGEAG